MMSHSIGNSQKLVIRAIGNAIRWIVDRYHYYQGCVGYEWRNQESIWYVMYGPIAGQVQTQARMSGGIAKPKARSWRYSSVRWRTGA